MKHTTKHWLLTVGALGTAVAVITGCAAVESTAPQAASTENAAPETAASSAETIAALQADAQSVMDQNEDQTVVNDDEYSTDDAQAIMLEGTSATTEASGVDVQDGTVTITEAGVYELSGSFTGSVVVAAADDALVVLMLHGVSITATDVPAIQIDTADDVAVFLVEGSENTLTSRGTYDDAADAQAALWSNEDLTLSGTGSLVVDGAVRDGITSEDDLVVLSGTIAVTSADDGLRGKDSLTVRGGNVTVDAGGDGFTSDNAEEVARGYVLVEGGTVQITAGSDGIDGFTDVVINDGVLSITALEGIEAGTVVVAGGTTDIVASDDGINGSAGTVDEVEAGEGPGGGMADSGEVVLIAGGTLTVTAGGDGLDSNGSLAITGGSTVVQGPTASNNGALDANGSLAISGGTIVALGSGGMEETPDSGELGWVAAVATFRAGQQIDVTDANGTVIAQTIAASDYGWSLVASADVTTGETYQFVVDGTSVASAVAGQETDSGWGW